MRNISCVTLYNVIWTHYRAVYQRLTDDEDKDHKEIPGAWRQVSVLVDLDNPDRGNYSTVVANRQLQAQYLSHKGELSALA